MMHNKKGNTPRKGDPKQGTSNKLQIFTFTGPLDKYIKQWKDSQLNLIEQKQNEEQNKLSGLNNQDTEECKTVKQNLPQQQQSQDRFQQAQETSFNLVEQIAREQPQEELNSYNQGKESPAIKDKLGRKQLTTNHKHKMGRTKKSIQQLSTNENPLKGLPEGISYQSPSTKRVRKRDENRADTNPEETVQEQEGQRISSVFSNHNPSQVNEQDQVILQQLNIVTQNKNSLVIEKDEQAPVQNNLQQQLNKNFEGMEYRSLAGKRKIVNYKNSSVGTKNQGPREQLGDEIEIPCTKKINFNHDHEFSPKLKASTPAKSIHENDFKTLSILKNPFKTTTEKVRVVGIPFHKSQEGMDIEIIEERTSQNNEKAKLNQQKAAENKQQQQDMQTRMPISNHTQISKQDAISAPSPLWTNKNPKKPNQEQEEDIELSRVFADDDELCSHKKARIDGPRDPAAAQRRGSVHVDEEEKKTATTIPQRQSQTQPPAQSSFPIPIYKLEAGGSGRRGIESLDINVFLDGFVPFVRRHKILFTNDVEAMNYFMKCDHRPNWIIGQEKARILSVLLGLNIPGAVTDYQRALQEYLQKGARTLDLTTRIGYQSLGQILSNQNRNAFILIIKFLDSNPRLIAYMKAVIGSKLGYFPRRGATQNRALWFYGQTNSGKSTMAQLLTTFLITCKITWTSEGFTNRNGERHIPNRAFCFNVLQLEEVYPGGQKGPHDLMGLLEGGVSTGKYLDASAWGSDLEGNVYHFPVIITSNFRPNEFFRGHKSNKNQHSEAAFLARVIEVEFAEHLIPNLANSNLFGVQRDILAKFLWAHIYHSCIEPDLGQDEEEMTKLASLTYLPQEQLDNEVIELLTSNRTQIKVPLVGMIRNEVHPLFIQEQQSLSLSSTTRLPTSTIHQQHETEGEHQLIFIDDSDDILEEAAKKERINQTSFYPRYLENDTKSMMSVTSNGSRRTHLSSTSSTNSRKRKKVTSDHELLALVNEFMYGISLFIKKKNEFLSLLALPKINATKLYNLFITWNTQKNLLNTNTTFNHPLPGQTAFGIALAHLQPFISKKKFGHAGTYLYELDIAYWFSQPHLLDEWSCISFDLSLLTIH